MVDNSKLAEISIRKELLPGDIGYITYLHGMLYKKEYGYGLAFETYVAKGFLEFVASFNPSKDEVWVCEHSQKIIGFVLLIGRSNETAQSRFFILLPEYRGIGLGKKLVTEFLASLQKRGFSHAYLWTTHEQTSAAALYTKAGFVLTEEKESTDFGKVLTEQRYDLFL